MFEWQRHFVWSHCKWIEAISTPGWLHHCGVLCVFRIGPAGFYITVPPHPLFRQVGRKRWKGTFFFWGWEVAPMQNCVCVHGGKQSRDYTRTMQTNALTLYQKISLDRCQLNAGQMKCNNNTKYILKKPHNSFLAMLGAVWESICAPFARALTCVMECKV